MNCKQYISMWLVTGLLLALSGHAKSQKVRCSSHVAKAFFMWCGMVKKRSVRSLDRFRTTRVVAVESEDSYQSPSSASAKSLSIGSALLRLLRTYDLDDSPQQLDNSLEASDDMNLWGLTEPPQKRGMMPVMQMMDFCCTSGSCTTQDIASVCSA